jgi:hypothetical protein
LVILHVVRIAVFDGWVSLDAVLAAQVLVHGAVHIGNESSLRVLEFIHELVPSRLHGFAVSSPRGEELDEHGFTAGKFIKVIGGELDGAGNSGLIDGLIVFSKFHWLRLQFGLEPKICIFF